MLEMVEAAGVETLTAASQCFAKSGFYPHKHWRFFVSQIFVKGQLCEEKRIKFVSNCLQKSSANGSSAQLGALYESMCMASHRF
jgi:hypothetical protein